MKNRSMKRISTLAAALAITLTISGCLKSRAQLHRDTDETEEAPPMKATVTEVKPSGEQAALVDEMRTEINRLRSRVEELDRANHDLNTEQAKRQKERQSDTTALEARIQELETAQAQMIEALKKKEKERTTEDNVDLVAKALKSFKTKEYHDTVETLDQYLKNPKGSRAEEAYFLRGESQFALKQYKKAILDFSAVNDKFPKSKKAPQCLLKIAQSFEALGMKSDAKIFYQELVDKFPKSAEAKRASAKL